MGRPQLFLRSARFSGAERQLLRQAGAVRWREPHAALAAAVGQGQGAGARVKRSCITGKRYVINARSSGRPEPRRRSSESPLALAEMCGHGARLPTRFISLGAVPTTPESCANVEKPSLSAPAALDTSVARCASLVRQPPTKCSLLRRSTGAWVCGWGGRG